jgi:hypothetical protein
MVGANTLQSPRNVDLSLRRSAGRIFCSQSSLPIRLCAEIRAFRFYFRADEPAIAVATPSEISMPPLT